MLINREPNALSLANAHILSMYVIGLMVAFQDKTSSSCPGKLTGESAMIYFPPSSSANAKSASLELLISASETFSARISLL